MILAVPALARPHPGATHRSLLSPGRRTDYKQAPADPSQIRNSTWARQSSQINGLYWQPHLAALLKGKGYFGQWQPIMERFRARSQVPER